MKPSSFLGVPVVLDPLTHRYMADDGVVPGVTEILSAVGVSTDFDELRAMSSRTSRAIDEKRDIGSALHADAHAYDDEDLDWFTVDPRVEPYLRAWAQFRANTCLVPITRERLVFDPHYRYAGTLDGIFQTPQGRVVLVDIKTGDPELSGCQYQTAAYAYAYTLAAGTVVNERWGVQLIPNREVPYAITPYTDWRDFQKFCAFVTTYYCQAARRRRTAS